MQLNKWKCNGPRSQLIDRIKECLSFTACKFIVWVSDVWNKLDGLVLFLFVVR